MACYGWINWASCFCLEGRKFNPAQCFFLLHLGIYISKLSLKAGLSLKLNWFSFGGTSAPKLHLLTSKYKGLIHQTTSPTLCEDFFLVILTGDPYMQVFLSTICIVERPCVISQLYWPSNIDLQSKGIYKQDPLHETRE